jgi:hypothetical protein
MKALQNRILSQKAVGFDGILRGFSTSELCFGVLFIIGILLMAEMSSSARGRSSAINE